MYLDDKLNFVFTSVSQYLEVIFCRNCISWSLIVLSWKNTDSHLRVSFKFINLHLNDHNYFYCNYLGLVFSFKFAFRTLLHCSAMLYCIENKIAPLANELASSQDFQHCQLSPHPRSYNKWWISRNFTKSIFKCPTQKSFLEHICISTLEIISLCLGKGEGGSGTTKKQDSLYLFYL